MHMVVNLPLVMVLLSSSLVWSAGCSRRVSPPTVQQAAQEPPLAQPPTRGKSVSADETR